MRIEPATRDDEFTQHTRNLARIDFVIATTRPLWARNGHELFYLTESGTLMRVGVTGGAAWAPTAPTKLFDARGRYGAAAFHNGRTYDVSPDGRRFLMIKRGAAGGLNAAPASMVVVLDWFEELKRRVAASQK